MWIYWQWGPGTKISPGGATVIRNRKFAPYWRSPLRQLLRICFVQMNISHGPFPNCERSWEEGMCASREEKKTSSPGKMHVLRTHFSTSRHTTLRHFHCIKINAEDSLLRFHKVKPVGLSKLPVPLTVAPPGESAIVPGPHWSNHRVSKCQDQHLHKTYHLVVKNSANASVWSMQDSKCFKWCIEKFLCLCFTMEAVIFYLRHQTNSHSDYE